MSYKDFLFILIYNSCLFSILVISGFIISCHRKLSWFLHCFLPGAIKIEPWHFKELCHLKCTGFSTAQKSFLNTPLCGVWSNSTTSELRDCDVTGFQMPCTQRETYLSPQEQPGLRELSHYVKTFWLWRFSWECTEEGKVLPAQYAIFVVQVFWFFFCWPFYILL